LNHSLCLENVLGQGYECEGRKIVESVIEAIPEDWTLIVVMDWSSIFWGKVLEDYPQIVVL